MPAYYLYLFSAGAFLSVLVTRLVRDQAIRRKCFDTPATGRHRHLRPVPRIGGVALLLAFAGAAVMGFATSGFFGIHAGLSSHTLLAILPPALLVFFLGLYDDLFSVGPYWKFGIEIIAAVWLYFGGLGIYQFDLYSRQTVLWIPLGLSLTIFWVLLVTNAFNLIDGLDGLAAGSALFSTLIIFVVSLWRGTSLVSLLSIALAGAIFGFLRYNFHPATIFLGDSGSLLIGFLLSALALTSSEKATTILAIAIPVVSFGLPVLDVTLSVVRRFLNSRPLFLGDEEHIHHKLIKRGLSHRDAVLVLYGVASIFGLLSLALLHGEVMLGFVFVVIGLGVWRGVKELRYMEFYELVAMARSIWYRRRIIANNLCLRRLTESLVNTPPQFSEICRVLQSGLEPLGFAGTAFSFPDCDPSDEALFPLRIDGKGRYCHVWKEQDASLPEWELRLELTTGAGDKLGDFFIVRGNASEPLWLDINLLDGEFRAAVSEAAGRTIRSVSILSRAPARSSPVHSPEAAAMDSVEEKGAVA